MLVQSSSAPAARRRECRQRTGAAGTASHDPRRGQRSAAHRRRRAHVLHAARAVSDRRPRRPQARRPHRAASRSSRSGRWIGRDLMPAEAKALGEDINRALLADDRDQSRSIGPRAARSRHPAHAGKPSPRSAPTRKRDAGSPFRSARRAPIEDLATLVCDSRRSATCWPISRKRLPNQCRAPSSAS